MARKQRTALVFASVLVTILLSALDHVAFATALPTIVGELSGVNHMLWVTTAFILASTLVMPVYGKLGDLIGHKSLFMVAQIVFLAGSVIGGLSPNMATLIAGRAVQGLGGGGIIILSQSIVADVVPPRQRGKYLGIIGAVFGVASVLGPILGGWFADGIGWRWVFWLNLPLGTVAFVAAAVFIHTPRWNAQRPKIDALGIATMAVAVTSTILITSWGGAQYAWGSTTIIGLVVVAIAAWIAFFLAERRAVQPIVPLRMFRNRNFTLTTIAGLLLAVPMFGVITYMPSYLQMITNLSAMKSGFLLIPANIGMILTTAITGVLASKTGRYKWMPIVSCLVTAVGLLLLSSLALDTPLWAIGIYMLIFGAGIGIGAEIIVLIAQNAFSIAEVSTATAANNFFRELGAAFGSAVVGTLFTSRLLNLMTAKMTLVSGSSAAILQRNSLTPAIAHSLPGAIKSVVVNSYNEALTPVFLYLLPLMLIGAALSMFIEEKPLAVTNETTLGDL